MMKIADETGHMVTLQAGGVLTKEDYEKVVPALEEKIERAGTLDALIDIEGVEKIEPGALLEDLRFDIRNRDSFRRVAMVGGGKLGDVATRIAKPFFDGELRHFDAGEIASARQWLTEGR